MVCVSLGIGLPFAVRLWTASLIDRTASQSITMAGPSTRTGRGGAVSDTAPESAGPIQTLTAEADQVIADLRQQFPDDLRTRHIEAQLRQRLGEADVARQIWQQCLEADPQDLEALVSLGMIEVESGDHGRAEPLLCAALTQSPADPQASCFLGNALVHQGRSPEAIDVLRASLAAHPDSLPNQVLLGQAYLQTKSYAKAKTAFLAATQLAPGYANAYHGLATACARLGQASEAAQYREQLKSLQAQQLGERIEQSRSNQDLETTRRSMAEVFVGAGQLCSTRGDVRRAEQQWARAVELNPDSTAARAALAELYQRQDRIRDVLNVLLPLKTLRATDVSLWLRLGQLHSRLDEFEQAEQSLRQVTSVAPQRALGYAALAQLYLQWKGRTAEASTAAGEAVRREPTAANFVLLSAVRDRCGDTRGALDAIERALQLEPGNGDYQQRYLALRRKI